MSMRLIFPVRYTVRSSAGWVQRGTLDLSAANGREARILAQEEIIRRCGLRATTVEVGPPR